MIDKIIDNHLLEILLIEGHEMVGLGVCVNGGRWNLREGACILWFFQDETFVLIIDFHIRNGVCCLESIRRAHIFNIML